MRIYWFNLLVDKVMFAHIFDYEYIELLIKDQEYVFVEKMVFLDN